MITFHKFEFDNNNLEKPLIISLARAVFDLPFINEALGKNFIKIYVKKNYLVSVEKHFRSRKKYSDNELDELYASEIIKLIREIFLKINFTDGLAFDLLKAWEQYEELIFNTNEKYREHFIHQFQDFLFGCFFLEKLWVSQFSILPKKRFFRRWLFASLYHDVGYPAETLSTMQNYLTKYFFNKVPNFGLSDIRMQMFNPNEQNMGYLIKNISLVHLFSENISLDEAHLNNYSKYSLPLKEIENLFIDEINQTHDHGVAGAIFFLKTSLIDLREVVTDPNTSHLTSMATEYEPYSHLIDDIFMSAAAIAGHNLRSYTYPGYTIDFTSRPIGALLILCDDLQEWDRRSRFVEDKNYAYELSLRKWATKNIYLKNISTDEKLEHLTLEYDTRNPTNTKELNEFKEKFFSSLSTLFDLNLSDLKINFFKEIEIKIKDESMLFKLDYNIQSHRIGRYDHSKVIIKKKSNKKK